MSVALNNMNLHLECFSRSVVSLGRAAVDLLIDLFKLLGLLLCDIQTNREVVIVLYQALDRASPIL